MSNIQKTDHPVKVFESIYYINKTPKLRVQVELNGRKLKPTYHTNPTRDEMIILYKEIENKYGDYEFIINGNPQGHE